MRAFIRSSSVSKVFEKGAANGTYNCFVFTLTKSARWTGWQLGVPFVGLYVDDNQHRITFDYDEQKDVLTETHVNLDEKKPDETAIYSINEEGLLVMDIEYNGVKSRRFYKKKP
ncbi:putative effector protein [Aphelenchoides fujianensis]|nr:putative effector protein [Aphelenchoides fujianensis]